MPNKDRNIPKRRFKEFENEDAWELRKLGEVVTRVTRKNSELLTELALTISAQHGLIDQTEFFDKRIASKDVSGYYLVKNGEFAYNKSTSSDAPWGAVKRLDRYDMGVLSTLYIVFGISNPERVSSNFLVTYFDTNLWHKEVQAVAAEGARNHGLLNISANDFLDIALFFPKSFSEQEAIGTFFSILDRHITLHQRKSISCLA
ncbi:TPA: restriction endonuclease subunit S [Streptococcus suis]